MRRGKGKAKAIAVSFLFATIAYLCSLCLCTAPIHHLIPQSVPIDSALLLSVTNYPPRHVLKRAATTGSDLRELCVEGAEAGLSKVIEYLQALSVAPNDAEEDEEEEAEKPHIEVGK